MQKFNSAGQYLSQIGGTCGNGNSEFGAWVDLAVDADNNVIVSDLNNCLIKIFNRAGNYLSQIGTTCGSDASQFDTVYSLHVDNKNNMFIADAFNDRVKIYSSAKTASYNTQPAGIETSAPVLNVPATVVDISAYTTKPESAMAAQDSSYNYPAGITNFRLSAMAGSTQTVSLTYKTNLKPSEVTPRKYNSTAKTYSTLSGNNLTITETTADGQTALKISYDVTDGGSLDEDGAVNGSITDPVGLGVVQGASTASSVAGSPKTGIKRHAIYGAILPLIIVTAITGICLVRRYLLA